MIQRNYQKAIGCEGSPH